MSSFLQYLKDTQGELHHVAWPTRLQTIVYTVIVMVLSILIALYLGLFDYIFTNGLRSALDSFSASSIPKVSIVPTQQATTTLPITITQTPASTTTLSTTTKK